MLPTGSILPVGRTGLLRVGELTDPEWDRAWPVRTGWKPGRVGELDTEQPESSPEWPDSDLFGEGLVVSPVRPERDPDELELLLLLVVSPPWASPPGCLTRNGDTGEPRSRSL